MFTYEDHSAPLNVSQPTESGVTANDWEERKRARAGVCGCWGKKERRLPTDCVDQGQLYLCLSKGSQCYPDECHFGPCWVSLLPACNEPQWGWTPCSPVPGPVFTNEPLNKSVLVPSISWSILHFFFQFTYLPLPPSTHTRHLAVSPYPVMSPQHHFISNIVHLLMAEYLFVGQVCDVQISSCVTATVAAAWSSSENWVRSSSSLLLSLCLFVATGFRLLNKEIKVALSPAWPISLVLNLASVGVRRCECLHLASSRHRLLYMRWWWILLGLDYWTTNLPTLSHK